MIRYCHNCRRITSGEAPMFCQFCGRTYDVKLCPRLHANPRTAQICSQCGSRELTSPQPRASFWLRPLLFLLTITPGLVLLAALIVFVPVFIQRLLADPNHLAGLMCVGLILGLAFYIWMHLPHFLRNGVKKLLLGRKKKSGGGHH
jgi:RNA polymerase subunit RPABC4/transcription elongation factor Spt4